MMSIWEVLSSVDGWMQLARFVLDARRMCMRLETAPMYRPRSVGSDVLSQVIDLHFKAFVEHIEEQGGFVPAYVKRAFWSYLGCGRPEGGFTLLRCDCGRARILAFSCKNRGFCPSCLGRRMSQMAANMVDNVLPDGVPIRQWVLSFPLPVRLWLLWKPELRKAVLAVVRRVLFGWYRRRAAAQRVVGGRTGAVACAQSFGSILNANLHFHLLLLDGVYSRGPDEGPLFFHEVRPPRQEEMVALVELLRHRIERLLRRRGLLDDEEGDRDTQEVLQVASASQLAATGERAGRKVRTLVGLPPDGGRRKRPAKCAESAYYNLHAGVRIGGLDAGGRERLLRYVLRPPVVLSRLSMREDGALVLRLKRAWRNGTRAIVLTPFELLERLAALVPKPNERFVSTCGVLAPNAAWRREVVPTEEERAARRQDRFPLHSTRSAQRRSSPVAISSWLPWRALLSRVFGVEALLCECGLLMHVHAVVLGSATTRALSTLARSAAARGRAPP